MFIIATSSHLLVSNDTQLDFGLLCFLQTESSGSDWEIEKASAAGFIPIDPGRK